MRPRPSVAHEPGSGTELLAVIEPDAMSTAAEMYVEQVVSEHIPSYESPPSKIGMVPPASVIAEEKAV